MDEEWSNISDDVEKKDKHKFYDAVTKQVGERKRFALIEDDAFDDKPYEILVDNKIVVLTPRILWVSWAQICKRLKAAKLDEEVIPRPCLWMSLRR